ncbi:MAG: hypothetical protein KKB50_16055 [Planctomycetes bacterium]|nr:hypothetical protein [Planctomycetota bacterium]
MPDVTYGTGADTNAEELTEFYQRVNHRIAARPDQIERMMANCAVFVTARVGGTLVGLARGVCDGVRGYLTECKLDPQYQGPAAVTRTDGRIEHDTAGIAAEMARRVLATVYGDGAERVDVVAWGTEVDFLEELGFKRQGGLVGMTMRAADWSAVAQEDGSPKT